MKTMQQIITEKLNTLSLDQALKHRYRVNNRLVIDPALDILARSFAMSINDTNTLQNVQSLREIISYIVVLWEDVNNEFNEQLKPTQHDTDTKQS